jgi:hypothetical protein
VSNVNGLNGTYIGKQKGAITAAEGRGSRGGSRRSTAPGDTSMYPDGGGRTGEGTHGLMDFSENRTVGERGP